MNADGIASFDSAVMTQTLVFSNNTGHRTMSFSYRIVNAHAPARNATRRNVFTSDSCGFPFATHPTNASNSARRLLMGRLEFALVTCPIRNQTIVPVWPA